MATINSVLERVAESQGRWSAAADALKKSYERARKIVFGLSTLAALLAAVSSQQGQGPGRTALAIISAVCMGVATFLTARRLGSSDAQAWVRARAASEALKREGYRAATSAEPYDNPTTSPALLDHETNKIENDVDDLIDKRAATGSSSAPTAPVAPIDYIERRLKSAVNRFYEPKAIEYRTAANRLRSIEFVLALVTAGLTAFAGVMPKDLLGQHFDLVVLTAVLTTLSAAILAFIEASRFDFIVTAYLSTARRLRAELANAPDNPQPGTSEWSGFVNRCETIMQNESQSWIAKFGKPQ